MSSSFIPSIGSGEIGIAAPKIDPLGSNPFRMGIMKTQGEGGSFSEVMSGLVSNLNNEVQKPDKMIAEAMINPEMDIHDVMMQVNKTEVTLNIATQATTKIIQGYEKIISLQV